MLIWWIKLKAYCSHFACQRLQKAILKLSLVYLWLWKVVFVPCEAKYQEFQLPPYTSSHFLLSAWKLCALVRAMFQWLDQVGGSIPPAPSFSTDQNNPPTGIHAHQSRPYKCSKISYNVLAIDFLQRWINNFQGIVYGQAPSCYSSILQILLIRSLQPFRDCLHSKCWIL